MRIAYLSTFYPFRGGIAQFNASLYRALEKKHQVSAFNFSRQYPGLLFPGKTQYVQDSERVDAIPGEQVLDTINPLTYFTTARRIKKFDPDLLVMKYWMSYFAPSLGYVASQLKKRARVVTVLDNVIPHEKRFFDKPLTRYFLRQNTGFVTMSRSVEGDLLQFQPQANYIMKSHPLYDHFGAPVPRPRAREALGIPHDRKVLLFFGFIRDYKGLDILLRAFSMMEKDYHLVIAGEPYGSFEKYRQLIDNNRNRENIDPYIEYISNDRVPHFFSAADLCVLPYKSATQSGITNISYHFNLPVVATDVGGLRETIRDGETGLIVDRPEAEAVSAGIRRFFELREQVDFLQNIEGLKKDLSWDAFADALTEFAERL
mgnify:FL=1